MFFDNRNIMSFFSGREKAATPTPSVDNIEAVSFEEEDNPSVKLGYHYRGTAEQIMVEKRKNAAYEGTAERREFHRTVLLRRRIYSWVGSIRLPSSFSRADDDHRIDPECTSKQGIDATIRREGSGVGTTEPF